MTETAPKKKTGGLAALTAFMTIQQAQLNADRGGLVTSDVPMPALGPGETGGMEVYARELARWGIETSIIVPGIFACRPGHLSRCEKPADDTRAAAYEAGPYAGIARRIEEVARGAVVFCRPMRFDWLGIHHATRRDEYAPEPLLPADSSRDAKRS
jgi:hypothetical protein